MSGSGAIVRLFRSATFITPHIPFPIAQTVAILIGSLVAILPTAANSRLRRNLGRVMTLPDDAPRVRKAARDAVRVQTLNYLDLFRAGGLTRADVVDPVLFEGREHVQAAVDRGKGVVLVSAHFGCVDRLGLFLPASGFPSSAIVEPLDPPELLNIIVEQRAKFGGEPFPLDKDVSKKAAGYLKRGWLLGLTADWDLQGTGVSVAFCGHRLKMPVGPALFAIRYGVPILVIRAKRVDVGRFHVVVDPPFDAAAGGSLQDRIHRTSETIAKHLERFIQADPDQWVMFHDVWDD